MFSGRNCLILGAATLGFIMVTGGCGSDTGSNSLHSFNGNSNVPGAGTTGSSAGAPAVTAGSAGMASTSGGATGSSGAPPATAGATATAGSTATGGTTATGGGGATATGGGGATATGGGGAAAMAGAGGGGTGMCLPPTGTHPATALDRSCWVATASDCAMTTTNMNPPVGAIDASTTTRWSTGVAMSAASAYTFQVDMGSPVMIAGISLTTNGNATDFALMLKVEVSTDGTAWNPAACGSGMTATDFSFAAVSARYVRLTQSGSSATTGPGSGWWSIYDFNVYGATAADKACSTPGTGATGATCTTPHAT